MNAQPAIDAEVSRIAAAIGEPARTRMLYCLMEGPARTSTELALVAGVTPSTASVHLSRLKDENLVRVFVQGRHRYYSIASPAVARALEGLTVLAGAPHSRFAPATPVHLRAARSCYDHLAGAIAVDLHDRFVASRWIRTSNATDAYELTGEGSQVFTALGIDVDAARAQRRRFAFGCLDWSERRPHLAGSLGAALLAHALKKKWVAREFDSRALTVTALGRREFSARFGLTL
ncbi:MAG TPA: helix-turn-helix transcriptional regulator [Acidobacteriaceae bacterium]|nr:helix-turn-helix transcriptional regulator [Acidobacteriaceae bacterium]